MPARILDRHVGGNTTYARTLADRLTHRGHVIETIPHGPHPVVSLLHESRAALGRGGDGEVIHYVADTGPLLRSRTPSLVTVHGVASRWEKGIRNSRQEWVWRARVSRAIRSTDLIITVSESSANDISEVFGVERSDIRVIHHGIDVAKFTEPVDLSTQLQDALPAQFLLYLGNIEPRKNLVELVKAMESPDVRSAGIPLVIAGKPAWNSEESMRLIEAADNVIYLGFVSDTDKIALMQRATLFLFPSRYEGFGFPVLEALAAGTHVVTSARGALAELAGPSTVLAEIDAEAIAAGIVAALSDDRRLADGGRLGREWAGRFSWDKSVDAHISAYEEVLAR